MKKKKDWCNRFNGFIPGQRVWFNFQTPDHIFHAPAFYVKYIPEDDLAEIFFVMFDKRVKMRINNPVMISDRSTLNERRELVFFHDWSQEKGSMIERIGHFDHRYESCFFLPIKII